MAKHAFASSLLPIRKAPLSSRLREPAPGPRVNDLIAAAQQGDEHAFRSLYEQCVDRIYAVCLRLSADAAAAEELTQDVFVRAWEKLASFRGESAFSTWLHRLAINVVLTQRRTTGRRERRVFAAGDLADLNAATRPVTPGVRLDLEQAIAALPEGARAVFVLHDIEGYRHEEIATMSGLAEGTSKAQLFRARRLLREMLDR
ncbi:MAG: RNA polymerase sigma factor [Gemmatimonadota bacterium]